MDCSLSSMALESFSLNMPFILQTLFFQNLEIFFIYKMYYCMALETRLIMSSWSQNILASIYGKNTKDRGAWVA